MLLQGDYTRMANLYGDVWEASNFGNAPLSLRITDNYGVTLVAPLVFSLPTIKQLLGSFGIDLACTRDGDLPRTSQMCP